MGTALREGEVRIDPAVRETAPEPATDHAVFAEVYADHWPRTVRFIAGQVRARDQHCVEDLAQTTFLRAWPYLHSVEGATDTGVRNWLCTIARHVVCDHYTRGPGPQHLRETAFPPDSPRWSTPDTAASGADAVAERVVLAAALAGLRPETRRVLQLRFTHDLPVTVVAQQLGRGKDHVRHLSKVGVAALRAQLTEKDPAGGPPEQRDEAVLGDKDTVSFKRVTATDRQFEGYRGRDGLDAVLAGLPEQTRRVVELRFTQNVPVAVVTQQLGLGKNAVQRLTQEGLAALRAQLSDEQPVGDPPAREAVRPGPAALPDRRRTDTDADREFERYRGRVGWDAVLAGLPPETRRVVELRFTQQLPVTVVARQVHRGTIHVRALTEAGLAVLRAQLAEQDPTSERPERREENTPHRGRPTATVRGSSPGDAAAVPEVAAVGEPRVGDVPDNAADLSTSAADTHADTDRIDDHDPAELADDADASARPGQPSTAALVAQAHVAVAKIPAPRAAPDEDGRRDQLARWHTDDHTDNSTDDRGGDEAGCDARRSGDPDPGAGREWAAMTGIGEMS